jgi:hypothetical protein
MQQAGEVPMGHGRDGTEVTRRSFWLLAPSPRRVVRGSCRKLHYFAFEAIFLTIARTSLRSLSFRLTE